MPQAAFITDFFLQKKGYQFNKRKNAFENTTKKPIISKTQELIFFFANKIKR